MITQEFDINIIPHGLPPRVEVDQYDTGLRTLIAHIYQDDTPLVMTDEYTYTVIGTKPSGTGFSYPATAENGAIVIDVTGQMTVVSGLVECGIIVWSGTDRVGTHRFNLWVQPSALTADTIIDSDDFGSIIDNAVTDWLNTHGIAAVHGYGTRITNANNAAQIISGADADNAAPNTIYVITAANLVSHTGTNRAGTLITFNATGTNNGGHVQLWIDQTGRYLWRIRWGGGTGTWVAWREVKEIDDLVDVNSYSGSIGIYNRFAVIGDSFASGEVYNSGGTKTENFYLSWGQQLARRLGNTCVNLSTGGLTTRTWLTNANGLAKLNSEAACDCYLLNLGINDANSLGTDYLGTISDINDGNPSANADTFYGNYGKIVEAIKAKAPNAHIIFVKTMRTGTQYTAFDTAIAEIAAHYGVPCIAPFDDVYFSSNGFTTQVRSHPTANDYAGIAMAIERLYSQISVTNYTYFQYYGANT